MSTASTAGASIVVLGIAALAFFLWPQPHVNVTKVAPPVVVVAPVTPAPVVVAPEPTPAPVVVAPEPAHKKHHRQHLHRRYPARATGCGWF
jgi:hypothetical protein